MVKSFTRVGLILVASLLSLAGFSQSWPVMVTLTNGDRVKLYEPQPESFDNLKLSFRSAVSLQKKGQSEPVFGTMWATAQTREEQNSGNVIIQSMSVSGLRFPASIGESENAEIEQGLETAIPALQVKLSSSELNASLERSQQRNDIDKKISHKPPRVIYSTKPSLLVVIDGEPVLQKNEDWGMEAVVNSPNTIVKHKDGMFYLYGGNRWYKGGSPKGPFQYTGYPPASLATVEKSLKAAGKEEKEQFETEFNNNSVNREVLVSTEPAELIQSDGEADFTPISNTSLLYVSNSPNDIFMDVNSQQYFVLLSGRWYRTPNLKNEWTFIESDQLPADFSKIPAGTDKDNVLASVAGTPAAQNALMDAQVPMTAKVDRNKATASVVYDGDPEFERISGTKMSYAINSSSTVIKYRGDYFLVDNGVWFRSPYPSGPWTVSNVRPDEVDLIPPSYPVYNVKYVYIYETTPDYVYMGYTPGYLNTYVYGPTVVYGTGYYYRPWHRRRYFARPYTWGFNVHYTPWMGWTIGFGNYPGWYNVGWGYSPWSHWSGGWWGPSRYRPSYCDPFYRNYGYYGYSGNHFYVNNYYYYNNNRYRNDYYYNNVYHQRRDVVTVDNRRPAQISRPVQNPQRRYTGNYDGRYNNSNGYNNRNDLGSGNRNNDIYRNRNNNVDQNRESEVSRRVRESIPSAGQQRNESRSPQVTRDTDQRPERQYRPQPSSSGQNVERPRYDYNRRRQTEEREIINNRPSPSSRPVIRENAGQERRPQQVSPQQQRVERHQISRPPAPQPARRPAAASGTNSRSPVSRPEKKNN